MSRAAGWRSGLVSEMRARSTAGLVFHADHVPETGSCRRETVLGLGEFLLGGGEIGGQFLVDCCEFADPGLHARGADPVELPAEVAAQRVLRRETHHICGCPPSPDCDTQAPATAGTIT